MKMLLMTAIKTSISEVMETMFFSPVEFGPESTLAECAMDKENTMACKLSFTGNVSGDLILVAPINLVTEMAENFMGESRDHLTHEHISGTLTEMANMVCGNALSKTNSKVPFELGIPEIIDKSRIPEQELVSIIETTLSKMAFILKIN